ncbi:oxidation resistance protein 1 isoform X11 [Tribolium castaneum]|uniref:oxidation resistance protein 1 isoform X11 n=1 Tax=Tribolium castaneum TaxID=7070 RepID=UPI00077D9B48|nr:PREDICTED: oxidation resistance protein 1 isoform X11 [Tribolium castaneum]|eukprot:XP_015835726.1 PREDICTED: oxidation resistance protein 1 isoform X11 [Tribolium castaneum]
MMNPEVLQVVHEKDPWIEESKWDTIEEEVTEIVDKKSRRKSWHAIKFERKRRKGVVEPGSPPEARQKRPSWWNIFGGQQWPRSRRASQDGGRVAKENVPWMRSKSRSVDHGISSPFDLDALRAKVDSQLDKNLDRDLDGSSNSLAEKKKTGPPENTTTYTVADRDTLTSVAARFDTTPSELTKLNRLATPYIFPGQQLYVPIRETAGNESEGSTPVEDSHDDLPPEEKELLDNLRPVSPKPGHVERVRTPSCNQSSTDLEEESAVFRERFLKINVRHITDGQGVVSGVLLVTPNAVMFDPNVSDPLVIEHGPEAYGVIAPMEFVVNAAIYNDIAHMRVGHSVETSTTAEKPEIYYPKAESRNEQDSMMVKDETFPELVAGDDAESVCSCTEREGDAFPKAFERELVTPTNLEENEQRSAEERRKSLLDHHWAIPSRDRQSIDTDEIPAISSSMIQEDQIDEEENLVKESCHDSGIDIRESSIPPVAPHPKKQYSDADIVLSKEWVPPITIAPTNVSDTESLARKKTNSVSFSLDSSSEAESGVPLSTSCSESKEETEKADTRKNKMLKRLSYPLSWMETLAGDKEEEKPPNHPHSADVHHSSVFSKVFSRRSSVGTFIRQPTESSTKSKAPPPKLDYRSMVSVDDMPELFVSFDMRSPNYGLDSIELIPRPARSCEDPPLYLRLRMGKPLDKPIPRSTPLMSYGKKKMRPEYWFSVPRNRVDELYKFIQAWVPHLYGELNEEQVKARNFALVEMDTELWSEEPTPSASRHGSQDGELTEITKESWELIKAPYVKIYSIIKTQTMSADGSDEVIPMSEEYRRAFYSSAAPSIDAELTPPDLIGTTEILTDYHREALCRHLPARAEGYSWTLVFSTSQHGFSLNSMYRKMFKLESPILLVIEDTDNNVFGALTSCALQVSEHFYGTGESLLFRFSPEFQVYNWTGENLYFIKGNNESLSIGAGDGKFGLWLDGDLYLGRSEPCKTYGNDPLTPKVDFVVKTLECWAFVSS